MGWFGKDAEPKEAAPTPKYTFKDFVDALPEPPPDPSIQGKVSALENKVLDLRVRLSELEARQLTNCKSIDDWFRSLAKASFCELRDSFVKDLRKEVVVSASVKEHIHDAVEEIAKDLFSSNEATTFAKELAKAVLRACGRKLGQQW